MSVYENMAFSLVMRKEDKRIIHRKVLAAAEILGLSDQLNKSRGSCQAGRDRELPWEGR